MSSLNHKERMLAGLPYKVWNDGLLGELRENKQRIFKYNALQAGKWKRRDRLIRKILKVNSDWVLVESPFHCDFGYNISVGENFYANVNCVILDSNQVTIGDNVLFGPNVSVFTAGHPIHPVSRNSRYQYGIPVSIGNNVWVGGNAVINPGVNIGDNVVIASGSVVTKDIPANVIAGGNPAKILREITDDDKRFYYKKLVFDVDDYLVPPGDS